MGHRRRLVDEIMPKETERVAHGPCLRVVDFQMKMGSHAAARIAADGYQLPAADGHFMRTQINVNGIGSRIMPLVNAVGLAMFPMITGDTCPQDGREILQMAINRTVTIGMLDKNGIAIAIESNGDA